jgi:protein-disulfide isomerase
LRASEVKPIETRLGAVYNSSVSKVFLVMCALALASACEKKPAKGGDTGAVNALDRAGGSPAATGPVDESPLQGIDVSKLAADKQKLFYKLVGSLSSPCGKAHSLRTSYASDTACKRAPFGVRYVASLVDEELTETEIREFYDKKYTSPVKPVKLDVSKAPRNGNTDAAVKLTEFFDYACPHCAAFKPMLDVVVKGFEGKVVVYYMMFPLQSHSDSKSAAQAALAANQLGKFAEMHEVLFKESPMHGREAVMGYAKKIGLDPGQFASVYDSVAAQVNGDLAQGDTAGVEATPTLYFNDRKYEGPMHPKYIAMWIEEELAVNR